MDPIGNPYAPGAGQRPPELAGREEQLDAFDVVLERIARGSPERSIVLTGLRGVGKTVLLNALRSAAVRAGGAPASSRPGPSSRCGGRWPRRCTSRSASSGPPAARGDQVLGTSRRSPARQGGSTGAKLRDRWNPGIVVPATGRADSGDIEIDLVELLTDVGGLAADLGRGVALFIDEMQDLGPDDVSALCAAGHEISQSGLPLIVVGAGLPHLPAVLSASKSYSERLFRYSRIDRWTAPRLIWRCRPGRGRGPASPTKPSTRCMPRPGATPTSSRRTARRSGTSRRRRRSPRTTSAVAVPEAEAELAVGFFGSRYERATPAEREYLRAMADVAGSGRREGFGPLRRRVAAPRAQAPVAVPGEGRADEEGPDLVGRAGQDRVHRAPLRPLPARARLTARSGRPEPVHT